MLQKYKILILYSEVMGYTLSSIKELVNRYPVKVFLVGWDKGKLTPFEVKPFENLEYKSKSEFPEHGSLLQYAITIDPSAIFISGWMDKDYLKVARYFRLREKHVVGFVDNQWKATWKQLAGALLSSFYLHRAFNKLWVSGRQQYTFAKKMGYDDKDIYLGFYSADTPYFHELYRNRKNVIQQKGYPKNITFLGRFSEVKNVIHLVESFKAISNVLPGWTLTLVGNGPLREKLVELSREIPSIHIRDFVQPGNLDEFISGTGIFCLPSINEPWGVVIHEFASAGVPMIVSDICGAATEFLEDGVNGILIDPGSPVELKEAILYMTMLPEEELLKMGDVSYKLSHKISPHTWADTVMKIIEYKPGPVTADAFK